MVVIGHSMGGCISRTLITDTGNKLWMEAFGKPPEQIEMPAAEQTSPRGGAHLQASTGNRARDFHVHSASRQRSGQQLDRTHRIDAGESAIEAAFDRSDHCRESLTPDPAALQLKGFPNSVDTLAPNNRFVVAINKIPITPGIPYHTIVGDRGRGDTPNSSDGVVAYWSSHLDGAGERIHRAIQSQLAAQSRSDRRSSPHSQAKRSIPIT